MTQEEERISDLGRRVALLQDLVPRDALGLTESDTQRLIGLPLGRRTRRRPWRILIGVAAVACTALLGVEGWKWIARERLVLSVKDQSLVNQRRVWIAADQGPVQLKASDGSVLRFGFGARARVETAETSEPTVALEQGALEADLAPAENVRWQVLIGPYALTASGAGFSLDWNSRSLELSVEVRSGRIQVQAPQLPTLSEVTAGQHLTIFAREQRFTLSNIEK